MTEMPVLKLTNTLTRTKEPFVPIDPANVRLYVCGPTVYDFAHIGNARPVIVFDVLFRLLRHLYGQDHVTYVRNITDVDDKINARALRDFPDLPLNEAIGRVTEKTASQFHADVKALGCLEPTHEPRATDFVTARADRKPDMVGLIQKLIGNGHAYETNGEVLFDTASMADYGALSGRNLDEQRAGARVAVDAHKKNPADFVLWKQSSADEPGWNASFTLPGRTVAIRGRPGWHIECSAMSAAYLGEVFDIHGGGLDLIFPHHENEIAQSRCAHGTEVMANYWLHNGFLQVEGRKMSKSDGNFVTIHDLLETEKFGGRKWPGEVLRLAMLMTHYRQPIDFSIKRLWEAEDTLVQWSSINDDILEPLNVIGNLQTSPLIDSDVLEALSDDLNTHAGLARLSKLADDTRLDPMKRPAFLANLELLGISLLMPTGLDSQSQEFRDLQKKVEGQVKLRLALIATKNWPEADRIRDELLAQGIQLKDGKDPITGERITTWEVKR